MKALIKLAAFLLKANKPHSIFLKLGLISDWFKF